MPDLIAIADLRTVCGLNANVEERKVRAGIREAHIRLKKHLGTALYDLVYASPATERFANILADGKGYGKELMCWTALAVSYPALHADADRAGVYTKSGDEHESVSANGLRMLKAQAESFAESRQDLLLSYLEDNRTTYPELDTITGSEDRITSRNSRSPGGIVMRRSARQDHYRG